MERKKIFTFGSNLAGIHGAGAAKYAVDHHGAIYGKGVGIQGESYAIPTKDRNIQTLPLDRIEWYVKQFIIYAEYHPEYDFWMTRIGCGLAGYTDADISPMFENVPENVILPKAWGGEGFDE